MLLRYFLSGTALSPILALSCASAVADELPDGFPGEVKEEVLVTATLRSHSLQDSEYSVTVLDTATLKSAGQQHFQDVLGLVPNLNWAAGTSRPRFFQVRGVGELDQFQGAPNPYVGFVVDDIDFSGLGGVATLYDVSQVEVLRGPQSITYGANAMAGLISVSTNAPKNQLEWSGEVTAGDYATRSAALVVGGPIDANDDAFRVVAQRYRSNGFRRNVFLSRDDTNGIDETTLRAKLRGERGPWTLQLTGAYIDQDNGYDAWSIDNSFHTQSDFPGRDAQRSKALAAKLQYDAARTRVVDTATYSRADVTYSFDDDWGNNALWLATTGYSPYNYYSLFTRQRIVRTNELRAVSTWTSTLQWVAGVYVRDLQEDDQDLEFSQDVSYDPVGSATVSPSRYTATNLAPYGQVSLSLGERDTVNVGLRLEQRRARYEDSVTPSEPLRDNLWGASLGLLHTWSVRHTSRVDVSRGYHAGGVNIGSDVEIPATLRFYGPEYLWNLELGDRRDWYVGPSTKLTTDATFFYMDRRDMQVSSSMQDPGNPAKFVFVTQNATSGKNYGAEFNATWKLDSGFGLAAMVSWLHADFNRYQYVDKYTGTVHVLDGRAQPHAPSYQFSISALWQRAGWMARVDLTGKSSFYLETSSNETAAAMRLVNAKAGYESAHWAVYGWARNLFDARYATRGFYFGNEPPDFSPKRYIQNGDPRQVGLTLELTY